MFIRIIVTVIVNIKHLHIDDRDNYLRCFYKFGNEQIGAILIKRIDTVYGYKTRKVPDMSIVNALIDYCKEHIG